MLQRHFAQRQTVGAALAILKTNVKPLSSENYDTIVACLQLLLPGNSGAVSGEVSLWFEDHPYDQDVDVVGYLKNTMEIISHNTAQQLGQTLQSIMQKKV